MTMKRKTLCITAVAAAACAALLGRLLWMGLSEFSPYRTYSQEESLAFFDGATQQWERIVADVAEAHDYIVYGRFFFLKQLAELHRTTLIKE